MRFSLTATGLVLACVMTITGACHAAPQSQAAAHSQTKVQPDTAWRPPAKPSGEAVRAEPLPASALIAKAQRHSLTGVGRRVIREAAAWRELWAQVHDTDEDAPLPQVDFTKDIVLAASDYALEPPDRFLLDSVGFDADSAVAVVTIEDGCSVTPAVEHLTLMVRVPRTSKSVRFVERRRQGPECRRTER